MITEDMIDRSIDELDSMPDEPVTEVTGQFSEEQPYLMSYLVAVSEIPEFNEDERELFFFIGLVLWRVMRDSGSRLSEVKDTDIEKVTADNDHMLDRIEQDSPGDCLAAVTQTLDDYPEPFMLKYILESILEEDDEDETPVIQEPNTGLAFYHLKIVLEALMFAKG